MTKTVERVRQRFFWSGLHQDVESWCRNCEVCCRQNNPRVKPRAPLVTSKVGYPGERVTMDIVGPFPKSANGNKYILVVSDYFTRWTEAFPIPNQEALTVAQVFVNEYVCQRSLEMNVLLLRQKEDVESAIINHGPYRLAPKFSSLELSPDQWFMKNSQKQAYVKNFHNAKMSALSVDSSSPRPSTSQENSQTQEIEISTDLASLGITSANPVTLQNVSAKAKVLLNAVGAIVEAPTSTGEQAYKVKSETMVRPHYVSIAKNGKVTCAACPGWNAFKICSYSLAVAKKTGKTADYVKWLLKKGPQRPNLTNLMTCDSPKGVGKKQQKTTTARRKGHRSANNAPPTTVVDRLPLRSTSTSNFSTNQHVSGPPNQQQQPTHQQSQPLHHFPHQQPLNSAPPSMVYQIYSNPPHTIHVDLFCSYVQG